MVNNRSSNGGRDDYFTAPAYADLCVTVLKPLIDPAVAYIIEPAAGNGELLSALCRGGLAAQWAMDIAPQAEDISQGNWFEFREVLPSNTVVFTNPPFGRACSMAVRFFNHAAALGAYTIAVIVPLTFRKSSIINRLDAKFTKIADVDGPQMGFYLPQTGAAHHVPTCFQVWRDLGTSRTHLHGPLTSPYFSFVKHGSNTWQFAIKRCGGRAGELLNPGDSMDPDSDYFLRATHGCRDLVAHALDRMDFSNTKDHTAGTRSVSKRELIAELTSAIDLLQKQFDDEGAQG